MFRHRFVELHGTLAHFRVNSPESDQEARLEIDGQPIYVDLAQYPGHVGAGRHATDARGLLARLCAEGHAATIGAMRLRDGLLLHWLLSDSHDPNLIPPTAGSLRTEGWHSLRWRLPWMVVWCALALASWPLLGWSVTAHGVLAVAATIGFFVCVLCSVPALISMVLVLEALRLLFQALASPSARASWRALAQTQRTGLPKTSKTSSSPHPIDRPAPVAAREPETDSSDTPELHRLSGSVQAITVTKVSAGGGQWLPTQNGPIRVSNRLSYRRYEFALGQQPLVMFTGANWADYRLFLAAGDCIEAVVVMPPSASPGQRLLVLALHNLEDDAYYACHRVMWPVARKLRREFLGDDRMTFFTRYHARVLSRMAVGLTPVLLAIGLPVGWLAHDYRSWWALAAVAVPGTVASQYLPYWTLDALWRSGLASKSQRFTERVYQLLGAGWPLRPDRAVKEL